MCGIAGIVSSKNNDLDWQATLHNMQWAIRHRGPDDQGVWFDQPAGIGLAHRRLSILDLSEEGHQPMLSRCGRFVISYNGEVYNYTELIPDLRRKDHIFRGHSDTEVILASIAEWGLEQAVSKFVGMFAFALWDRRENELYLVRDRLGIKPLYYRFTEHICTFGSEIKSLQAVPGWQANIDHQALGELLRLGYVPSPMTIFEGVNKLPPGHLMKIKVQQGRLKIERLEPYWNLTNIVENARGNGTPVNEEESLEQLRQKISLAVSRRMIADVPLGAFLSGGVDSSLIVSLMQEQSSRPVKTFSIGFDDQAFDEASHAAAVAKYLGTEHHELYLGESELREIIPDLAEVYDEPFADESQLPTILISKFARNDVTVVLSGDGGDEICGGYTRHIQANRLRRFQQYMPGYLRTALGQGVKKIPRASWDAFYERFEFMLPKIRQPGEKLHKLAGVLSAHNQGDMYESVVSLTCEKIPVREGYHTNYHSWWRQPAIHMGAAEEFMFRDMCRYLPDCILTKVDRATMAVGLEARVPLIDHEVIEFASSIPIDIKLAHGKSKWLLKQLLSDYVPPSLWERPKTGFTPPVDKWLRGPLRDWVEAMLSEHRLKQEGFLEAKRVRQTWESYLAGKSDAKYHLWSILMFQSWLEKQKTPNFLEAIPQ